MEAILNVPSGPLIEAQMTELWWNVLLLQIVKSG